MKIENILKRSVFSSNVETVKHMAFLILPKINAYFPTYTDHGVIHSENVLKIIDTILSVNYKKLTEEELFCLYCAAWLHDIGMIGDVDPRLMTDYYREKIRNEHHIRSFNIIKDEKEKFGLDERLSDIIGWICRAHSSKFEEWEELQRLEEKLNVRLCTLAAILRLADELDLTPERAGRAWSERTPPARESSIHFDKHLSVKEVKVKGDTIIVILYRLGTSYDEAMKEEIRKKIFEELEYLKGHLEKIGLRFSKVECILSEEDAPYLSMLIRQDVLWCLSINRRVSLEDMARIYKHNRDAVRSVLTKLVNEELVIKNEDGTYSLKRNNEVFFRIAGIFLAPSLEEAPGRSFGFKKGGMHFISSTFVEDCITDEFVSTILKEWGVSEEDRSKKRPNWLSIEDYKHIFKCSPTALRRAMFPATEFTRRVLNEEGEIIMGRDETLLRFAVLTGLIHDYIRYHEVAPLICEIECFKVVVKGFRHLSRSREREVLHSIQRAQYGPFNKEFQYGYYIKFKEVPNDWGI